MGVCRVCFNVDTSPPCKFYPMQFVTMNANNMVCVQAV